MCVCACIILSIVSLKLLLYKPYINLVLDYYNNCKTIILKRLIHYKTVDMLTSLFTLCIECCGHANCLCIPIDREESNVRKDKRITMAQSSEQFRKSDTATCCLV